MSATDDPTQGNAFPRDITRCECGLAGRADETGCDKCLAESEAEVWPLCKHNLAVGACPTCDLHSDAEGHQTDCICADCSGAELTSGND